MEDNLVPGGLEVARLTAGKARNIYISILFCFTYRVQRKDFSLTKVSQLLHGGCLVGLGVYPCFLECS